MRIYKAEDKHKMLLSELATQYRSFQEQNRLLSENTRSNYVSRVNCYIRAHPQAVAADLTRSAIARFLHKMVETKPGSVIMYRAALRHFCLWLKSQGMSLHGIPTDGIKIPKLPRSRRDSVPDDALELLLDACDRIPRSEYRRALARAALSVLVYGGLRRSELMHLRTEDIDLTTGRVWIRCGKGSKSRTIYLCKEGLVAVQGMQGLRGKNWCDEALFLSPIGKPLRAEGLMNLLRDLHQIAKLSQFYTPHQLRHAYASRLARNGVPLPVIQELLGHANLATTALYVHVMETDLIAAADKASLRPAVALSTLPETPKTAPAPTSAKQEGQKRFHVRRRLR